MKHWAGREAKKLSRTVTAFLLSGYGTRESLFSADVADAKSAAVPVLVPIKIDGPVHNPAIGSYWYGPFNESCSLVDVNGDGRLDITCGVHWYEAPKWKKGGWPTQQWN